MAPFKFDPLKIGFRKTLREYQELALRFVWEVREEGAPSEKLVYLYLVLAGPQRFTTIRRGLALGERTVDIALRRLRERGYVTQDSKFLYWIKDAIS